MARDPPSLVASSELRDLSLEPSDVRPARITIVHHQLRDLVLPLDRGHVLYPRGSTIEELRWSPAGDDEPGPSKERRSGTTRTFARLTFTPNCLTATGPIMACGGQGGELYMSNLPSRTSSVTNLNARFPSSPPPIKPFILSAVLPTMSINNSMIILPGWPGEWHRRERQRRAAFLRRHGPVDMDEESEDEAKDQLDRGDPDEVMDLDDDEFETTSSGFATYPNTVPFVHPPRIPHLSPTTPSMDIPATRRAASFSDPSQPARPNRPSFSHSLDRPGLPPIQYVTSIPSGPSSMSSATGARRPSEKSSRGSLDRPSDSNGLEEPRLLISNNDQTIKMFSLPVAQPNSASSRRSSGSTTLPAPYSRSQQFHSPVTSAMRRTVSGADGRAVPPYESQYIHLPRLNAPVVPPPPRFGSSLGYDSLSANEGLQSNARSPIGRMDRLDTAELEREIANARAQLRAERENRRRTREEFERVVGMRVGLGSGSTTNATSRNTAGVESWGARHMSPGERGGGEERKLAKVGGARFKCPVNHSSLSPDMKTLVSVGDTSEVYLLQVIDGGREFKRIGTYSAATDAGFSSSWSKDGRKFAVASQDGQVTVWDIRSSNPLATFHTTSGDSSSFTSDLSASRRRGLGSSDFEHDSPYQADRPNHVVIDPSTHRNENGREPARVVKFSPEGSSRDLMVFSEDNNNIHIVDARTFHTHVIVPVPWHLPGSSPERTSVEIGVTGIAGLAFDPSGDWLYAGTEGTVVEWDMRRVGGGENATWQMA